MKIPKRYRKLVRTCRALGVPVSATISKDSELAWDGKTLNLFHYRFQYSMKHDKHVRRVFPYTLEHLYHEMAHWVVAAPYRRKHADFGLGESIPSENEELCASLLGISHAPTRTQPIQLRNQRWLRNGHNPWMNLGLFLAVAKSLEDAGYVKNGRPTRKIRQVGGEAFGYHTHYQRYYLDDSL